MKNETVLVTGAAGFIGSHLCEQLLQLGYSVIAADNLSMGSLEHLVDCSKSPNFSFHKVDVTQYQELSSIAPQLDHIVHLAARKIPRYGGAIDTLHTNAFGADVILKIATEHSAKAILISTSDVYGKNPDIPFDEDSNLTFGSSKIPRWSYAVSKLFTEHLAFAYAEAHGTKVSIARLFGSYGPRHHLSWWGGPQSVFISAVLKGESIELHGDGLQSRSFCYVSDTVNGLVRMLQSDDSVGEIFNIGNNQEVSIKELAHIIYEECDLASDMKINYVPYASFGKYEDVKRRVPNLTKSKKLLGYEPLVSLRDGLRKTIEWQRTTL